MTRDDWSYQSEEQRREMDEDVTKENCWAKLKMIQDVGALSRRSLSPRAASELILPMSCPRLPSEVFRPGSASAGSGLFAFGGPCRQVVGSLSAHR